MIGVQIHPVDTWFFRDGTPFEDTPWLTVESLFPPHPPTMVGALRAAVARENGWNGQGSWSPEIREVLGDGPDDLGRISFDGPFLLRDGQRLYRAPRHLLGVIEDGLWHPKALLGPGGPVQCDLGEVRLPQLSRPNDENEQLVPGRDQWLTVSGMNRVLADELPDAREVVPSRHLWKSEQRIGLQRDVKTRTAREGMLFSSRHARPAPGVSLGARITGLPPIWTPPSWGSSKGQVTPIGGESRLGAVRGWDPVSDVESSYRSNRTRDRFAVVALTPLDVDSAVYLGGARLAELAGARVVSACMDRPLRIGGWDSRNNFGPLPIRSVLAPGSVLFCEIDSLQPPEVMVSTIGEGPVRIGARTRLGFGLVALGVWPGHEENT
ncbi:MAG: hypothetical protein OXF41_08230 [bacterium]|nr:hypothetical protein [bacterium]